MHFTQFLNIMTGAGFQSCCSLIQYSLTRKDVTEDRFSVTSQAHESAQTLMTSIIATKRNVSFYWARWYIRSYGVRHPMNMGAAAIKGFPPYPIDK